MRSVTNIRERLDIYHRDEQQPHDNLSDVIWGSRPGDELTDAASHFPALMQRAILQNILPSHTAAALGGCVIINPAMTDIIITAPIDEGKKSVLSTLIGIIAARSQTGDAHATITTKKTSIWQ
jgi:hypothetical protein